MGMLKTKKMRKISLRAEIHQQAPTTTQVVTSNLSSTIQLLRAIATRMVTVMTRKTRAPIRAIKLIKALKMSLTRSLKTKKEACSTLEDG